MTTITVTCPCGCGHTFTTELPKKAYAPREGSVISQIWGLCRELSAGGTRATRKQVMELGRQYGLNDATLSTQYQRWLAAEGKNLPLPVVQLVVPKQVVPTQVAEGGGI